MYSEIPTTEILKETTRKLESKTFVVFKFPDTELFLFAKYADLCIKFDLNSSILYKIHKSISR